MASKSPNWKTKEGLAVGKGATVQEFYASVEDNHLEIDVTPWGIGHLRINGREIASVDDAKDRRQAFRQLADIAASYLKGEKIKSPGKKPSPTLPEVKAKLLEGKKRTHRRHCQRPIHCLGVCQSISRVRCRGRCDLSQ